MEVTVNIIDTLFTTIPKDTVVANYTIDEQNVDLKMLNSLYYFDEANKTILTAKNINSNNLEAINFTVRNWVTAEQIEINDKYPKVIAKVQNKFNKPNVIYKITKDYDLNHCILTIPEGCTLQFEGGTITNGVVIGDINNDFVDITWFGAKENTDSSGAIQNAINVCNKVYIPKVSEGALFIIQEDIYINKPTQIYGELGNKIGNLEDITTLTLFKVVDTEHVHFYNLNLTNGTASTEKVTREISGAINIDNCTDITIDNCKIDNVFGHWGVKVRNTTNIKVEHTSFSNITYNMLFFEEGCRNILVNNCSFINVTSLYEADRKYMVSTGVTNYTDPFPVRVDNFKVTNCYFENNSFWEAIDSHGGTNVIIENNIIKNCAIGIAVNADNRPALSIPTDNVIIQNNYIEGWAGRKNYFGINATSGVYDYFGTNYYIANNIVIDYNTDNNNISGAIRLVGLRNATVINNVVKSTSSAINRIYNGIYLVTCLDSIISENNVSNCIYGIRCERGDYNIKITSNIFKDLDRANIVINNTYSGLLDISGNITTPTNSGDAVFTNSTNCTGIKTYWIIGKKGFFIRTLDQRPLFAYTHDNIKRNGSTMNVLLTVSSTGELRVKDETVDLLRYITESESLTLNSNSTNYPVIIDKFTSPYRAQILNWTGGDVEIESITYDTCECVSVTSEVKDSIENLNNVFVGYEYFNKSTNQIMTKDNTGQWLNMDGTLYNKVKILSDKSFINNVGQNKIIKIVSDIDLQGEELIIPYNCTLDFQGGSFSNGTIVGSNTKINAGLQKIFNTDIIISGTWNVNEAYPEWFGVDKTGNTNNSISFSNAILLSNTIKINNGKYLLDGLDISKPINIIGEGAINTTLILTNPIDIHDCNGTSISKVTIEIADNVEALDYLIKIYKAFHLTIESCTFYGKDKVSKGLYSYGDIQSYYHYINNNRFVNLVDGVYLSYNSNAVTISNNEFYLCTNCVLIDSSNGCRIENNTFQNYVTTAIFLDYNDYGSNTWGNIIQGNYFEGTPATATADIDFNNKTQCRNNTILGNKSTYITLPHKHILNCVTENTIIETTNSTYRYPTKLPGFVKLQNFDEASLTSFATSEFTGVIAPRILESGAIDLRAYVKNADGTYTWKSIILSSNANGNQINIGVLNATEITQYAGGYLQLGYDANIGAKRLTIENSTGKIKYSANGSNWRYLQETGIGTTANRPTEVNAGFQYFDTSLSKYICWNGTAWVNLDGTPLT